MIIRASQLLGNKKGRLHNNEGIFKHLCYPAVQYSGLLAIYRIYYGVVEVVLLGSTMVTTGTLQWSSDLPSTLGPDGYEWSHTYGPSRVIGKSLGYRPCDYGCAIDR